MEKYTQCRTCKRPFDFEFDFCPACSSSRKREVTMTVYVTLLVKHLEKIHGLQTKETEDEEPQDPQT